jgi:hypothetical protein
MADVKITELPAADVPNSSTIIPCVIQGTTKKLSLDKLKTYLDIPTLYVKKVQAAEPLQTIPSSGIVDEGSISLLEASDSTPGSMSIEHYQKLQTATYTCQAAKLVIRDSAGSFQANIITLKGIGGNDDSGTLNGNLTQRKATDVGVNAKIGESTRYTAKVTSLDASEDSLFAKKVTVTAGPVVIGGADKVQINANGSSAFSGTMSVGGDLSVTGILSAEINTTGAARPSRFSTLTATTSISCGGDVTITQNTAIGGNLSIGSGKTLNLPNGFVNSGAFTAADRMQSDIYTAIPGHTAQFYGVLTGSAEKLTTPRFLSVAGAISGTSALGFTGEYNLTIPTTLNDGVIKNRHFAADAEIEDSRLKTITTAGKVSDSATSATSVNTGNTIVRRDGSGNFSAGTITATLNGTATYATSLTTGATAAGYTWTGNQTFQYGGGGGVNNAWPQPLSLYASAGGCAALSMHIAGVYALNLGLDPDGTFRIGGWSDGGGVTRFSSDRSGNLTARANVTAYSDERKKTDWSKFSPQIVEKLSQVKAGTYSRTDVQDLRQVGVSAQSLGEVIPEAVIEDANGELSVAYGNAALAMCVELAKEVMSLKAEIKSIKEGVV